MLSYQHDESGEWLALAMPERLLLVRRQDAPGSTGRLWAALGTGNGAQAVLDELTSGGLFSAPAFALLNWDGDFADAAATVHTIVRGDISVQLDTTDGPQTVTGRAISTWVEQAFSTVTGFTVSSDTVSTDTVSTEAEDSDRLPLPIGVGVVQAGWVASTEDAPVFLPQDASRTDLQEQAAAHEPTPAAQRDPAPAPIGEETIVNLDSDDPGEAEFGATVVRDADPHSPSGPAGSNRSTPVEDSSRIDLPTFITGSGPAPSAPGAAKAAASGAAPPTAPTPGTRANAASGDHDGMTVMSGDIQKLRNSRKLRAGSSVGSPAASTPESSPAAPSLYLLLPSGAREPLSQPVLVGRSPSVSKVSGGQVPRLVSLGGADQDISRNHVQFQVEGDTVVVTDLHSRNGTMILLPGKTPQKLRQGEPTSVIVGTIVDLGSGISLTVCED